LPVCAGAGSPVRALSSLCGVLRVQPELACFRVPSITALDLPCLPLLPQVGALLAVRRWVRVGGMVVGVVCVGVKGQLGGDGRLRFACTAHAGWGEVIH
jgi:hypothetical protein